MQLWNTETNSWNYPINSIISVGVIICGIGSTVGFLLSSIDLIHIFATVCFFLASLDKIYYLGKLGRAIWAASAVIIVVETTQYFLFGELTNLIHGTFFVLLGTYIVGTIREKNDKK